MGNSQAQFRVSENDKLIPEYKESTLVAFLDIMFFWITIKYDQFNAHLLSVAACRSFIVCLPILSEVV